MVHHACCGVEYGLSHRHRPQHPHPWGTVPTPSARPFTVLFTVLSSCAPSPQIPTQSFFTDETGIPVTMNPNFEVRMCVYEAPGVASSTARSRA